MNIVDRFLKYVSFCTTSDENTGMTPSTPGQMEFAKYLAEELKSIGVVVSADESSSDVNSAMGITMSAATRMAAIMTLLLFIFFLLWQDGMKIDSAVYISDETLL